MTVEPGREEVVVSYGEYLRHVADDPDQVEAGLRAHMRDAARIIDKQTEALNQATDLTRLMGRRFAVLSILLWVFAALFVARTLGWI